MTSRAEIHNVMVAVTIILRLRVICNCSCWHIHTVALFNFKLWADYIRGIFAEFISSSVSSRSVKNLTCKRSMFHSRWNYGYIEVLKWLLASCLSPLWYKNLDINPIKAELNPIRHLLALVGARHIVHVSRIRVNTLKTLIVTNQYFVQEQIENRRT